MRKVNLTLDQQQKYQVIKRVCEGHITKKYASIQLGCTQRQINRLIEIYKSKGKVGYIHGNANRKH